MTPLPSEAELFTRGIYDPVPGSTHACALANQLKDGVYAKDKIGDGILGVLVFAAKKGLIPSWIPELRQIPLLEGGRYRRKAKKFGNPFLEPDNKVIKIGDRVFNGGNNALEVSPYDIDDICRHPNYAAWARFTLFGNGKEDDHPNPWQYGFNSKKKCDANVNGKSYKAGPLSVTPANYVAPVHPVRNYLSAPKTSKRKRTTTSDVRSGYKARNGHKGREGDDADEGGDILVNDN